jgi:hypothetical protein
VKRTITVPKEKWKMRNTLKQALVLLMAFAIICTSVPMNVQAATNSDAVSFGRLFDSVFGTDDVSAVSETPTAMEINGADSVSVGSTIALSVAATEPVGAPLESSKVEWSSSNTSTATVSSSGDVSGIATGKTKITAKLTLDNGTQLVATRDITVSAIAAAHHYKLATGRSSNVALFYTTGGELQVLNPGEEVVTTSPNIYFFIHAVEGYEAQTEFEHIYVDGTGYSEAWGTAGRTEYSTIDDTTYNMPYTSEASAAGCTYKCQYTGKTISGGNAFWAQFGITAKPIRINVRYAGGGENVTVPTDATNYYHNNVTEYDTHTITLAAAPTNIPEDKIFYGWVGPDNVLYQPGDQVSIETLWGSLAGGTEVTFTAQWEDKVKVAYYPNGATSGTAVSDDTYYKVGETATVKNNTWVRYNYNFIGWADETGTIYQPGANIIVTASTKLYAQWQPKQSVAINYKVSGQGTVTPKVEYVNPDDGQASGSVAAPAKGYHFVGWYDAKGNQVGTSLKFVPSTPTNGWGVGATFTAVFEKNTELVVQANSLTHVYDGKPHTVEGFTSQDVDGSAIVQKDGENYFVSGISAGVTKTDADVYEVAISGTPVVKDSKGNIITDKCDVILRSGSLIISPRSITVTAASATKTYDGTALTKNEANITSGSFVDGEGAAFTVEGSRTVVGVSDNTITSVTFNDQTKSSNYQITTLKGTLEIKDRGTSDAPKYEVTITAASRLATYDGTEKSVSGFVNENSQHQIPFTIGGVSYYVDVTDFSAGVTATDAGITQTSFDGSYVVKDAAGNDVTSQFTVKLVSGTLTIDKRNVTLTSATATGAYTSSGLSAASVLVGGSGFAQNEGATYTFPSTSKVTLPNTTVSNVFTYELKDNTKAENYNISTVFGTLTMTGLAENARYRIQVEANSGSFVYDGQPHTIGGLKTTTFTVPGEDGKVFTVSGLSAAEVTATDVKEGGYAVAISGTATVRDNDGNDVTELFAVETKSGTLNITKRPVLLTSASAQKVYDGTALTAESVTDTYNAVDPEDPTGFVGEEGATYVFTGSRTLPGISENSFTYILNGGTKADNYVISTVNGTLNVQNRGNDDENPLYTIALQPLSDEVIYNGSLQQLEGFEETSFTFDGQTYQVSGIQAISQGIEPGVYESTYSGSPVVTDAKGNDVTDQFTFDLSAVGTLTIKGIYTLTINYVDTTGRILADPYVGHFVEGTVFETVVSPTIAGYTPNYASVSSPADGMPNRDITVDVVYTAAAPTTPDDGTPSDGTPTTPTTPEGTTPTTPTTPTVPQNDALTPGTPVVAADDGNTIEDTTIDDGNVPQGVISIDDNGNPQIVSIEDEATPLAAGENGAAWALINLIAAILTVLICILLLISLLKKKKEEDEEEENAKTIQKDDEDEDEKEKKQRVLVKVLSLIPAVASVIAFILTENMKNPMRWVDRWTILMIILLVIEILMAFFSSKKEKKDKEEEEMA